MKRILKSVAFLGLSLMAFKTQAQTPSLEWVNKVGFPNTDMNLGGSPHKLGVKSITVDKDKNTFICGFTYSDSLTFYGPNNIDTSTINYQMTYFSKFNPEGDLLWTKTFEGIEGSFLMEPVSCTTDNAGNLYLVGSFRGTIDFDPGSGTISKAATTNTRDGFLIKLDNNGNYIGGAVVPSPGNVYVTDVAVDNAGSPVICYRIETWNTGVIKFNPTLTGAVFQKYYGNEAASLMSVKIGANNDVFVAGIAQGFNGITFGTEFLTNMGGTGTFYAKYNSSGTEQFLRFITNINEVSVYFGDMVVTSTNDVFISGQLSSTSSAFTMNFDHTGATTNGSTVPFSTNAQTFLLKYNELGNFEKVTVQLSSQASPLYSYNTLSKDAFDNVYLAAFFFSPGSVGVDFNPGTESFLLTPGSNGSTYILKVDSDYNFMGAGAISTSLSWTNDIAVTKDGEIIISGLMVGDTDFDMSSVTAIDTITAYNNCYLTKYSLCLDNQVIDDNVTLAGNVLSATQTGALYQWFDCNNGNSPIIGATSQNFTPTVSGNYGVNIFLNGCSNASECTSVTVSGVGINENELTTFAIYPNPATDQVTISNIEAGTTVVLVDVTGKVVSQVVASSTSVNVETSNYTPGVYFVTVSGINGTQKLVIE